MSEPRDNPDTVSTAYNVMSNRWYMISALMEGTEGMRAAGEELMPKHERERDIAYSERLDRSILFNMFEVTLDLLSNKPFTEEIFISEDMDPRIVEILTDIDLQGNDINRFAYEVFRTALAKAFTHVLIDMPQGDGTVVTKADEIDQNIRPYAVHIMPENMIFMEAERINGVEVLTHVRFKEYETTRDGFAEVETEYVRVLELRNVGIENSAGEVIDELRMVSTRYKKNEKKGAKETWVAEEPVITDFNRIPLQTFYTDRNGLMLGKPPLLDLAYMNVAHFQSYSDQMAILTVTRFPLLAASGIDEEEIENMVVGPKELLYSMDPAGRFYFVEHSGAAIEAGFKDLQQLEARMATYGASLMVKRPDRETAAARERSEGNVLAPLKRMALGLTDALNTLIGFMADGMNIEAGGTVKVSTIFEAEGADVVELQTLQVAYKDKALSRETFLAELKRRKIVDQNLDINEESSLIEGELALERAIAEAKARSRPVPSDNGQVRRETPGTADSDRDRTEEET